MKTMILIQQHLITSLQNLFHNFYTNMQDNLDKYPYLTFLVSIIVLTIFMVAAVTLITIVLIVPLSFLFGWI